MNDMSSQELQRPEVNLSSEANKHLGAAENSRVSRLKTLAGEKTAQLLKIIRQKPLLTAAGLLAVSYAGCNNVEQQNIPPPIPPPPATSELPTGMPSAAIEFTPTPPPAETPSPGTAEQKTPTPAPEALPTPTPIPPEAIPQVPPQEKDPNKLLEELRELTGETRAIYSKLMDDIEASVSIDKRFFVKIGGQHPDQPRALIFTEPIVKGEKIVWVAMTSDGPKSFSLQDIHPPFHPQLPLPKDYIETFIQHSIADQRQGTINTLPSEKAGLFIDGGKLGAEITSLDMIHPVDGTRTLFDFQKDPLEPHEVEEAMLNSQREAGLGTKLPTELARKNLETAKSMSEALTPHLNPQSPPISQSH